MLRGRIIYSVLAAAAAILLLAHFAHGQQAGEFVGAAYASRRGLRLSRLDRGDYDFTQTTSETTSQKESLDMEDIFQQLVAFDRDLTAKSMPTTRPTRKPRTMRPTNRPTRRPLPTSRPTRKITDLPTLATSGSPTRRPRPTEAPTASPVSGPTGSPTRRPRPTEVPTSSPASDSTALPTRRPRPTEAPTNSPASDPTEFPTRRPRPTDAPTISPASDPTVLPTRRPRPTEAPTRRPRPTEAPTPGDGGFCACSPAKFDFVIDFSNLCGNVDIGGPGVAGVSCTIGGSQDLNAVVIDTVTIEEVNAAGQVIGNAALDGPLTTGTIVYTSVISTPTITPPNYPVKIRISMDGRNAADEPLEAFFEIDYTNSCTAYPVVSTGENLAWLRLVCPEYF